MPSPLSVPWTHSRCGPLRPACFRPHQNRYDFFNAVGLPTTFADLGIPEVTDEEIMKVAECSMHSYWDVEPFTVNPQMVFDGIKMADVLGRLKK